MRAVKRRYIFLLFAAVLLLGLGVTAKAKSSKVQITDQAQLLTQTQAEELSDLALELELSAGWDIMAVTVRDAGGMTATEYAETWFDENTEKDDGVICLVDMDNRELVIRTFGEAIYYLTDERVEGILDSAYNGASEGDYYAALESMLIGIDEALQRGIPSDQYTFDEDTGQVAGYYKDIKRITLIEVLLAAAAALAAGGITVGVIIGKYRLKWGGYQYSCRENGSVELKVKQDRFVNQMVTHRRIPKDPPKSSGGGGSRSTVRRGAGGRTSGGGSRKF